MTERKPKSIGEVLGEAMHALADSVEAIMEKDPKEAKERIVEARTATDEAAARLAEVADPVTREKILEMFPQIRETIAAEPQDFGPCMEITKVHAAPGKPPKYDRCGKPSVYDGKRCSEHRSDRPGA